MASSTLVIYYSYTGNTRKLAKQIAEQEQADLFEVVDRKRIGIVKTYLMGAWLAMHQKASPVEPILANLNLYDRIIIMAPIWAGYPAAPINNVFQRLPAGKSIDLRMVSGSGYSSSHERVRALIEAQGCFVVHYEDIKRSSIRSL